MTAEPDRLQQARRALAQALLGEPPRSALLTTEEVAAIFKVPGGDRSEMA